ncbi:MAG: penicillin-binding protein 2 [Actinobacteria bacterium]|nr:MAG: penicillin-binding protein 2 [Actinomycetota bacterium]
MTTFQQQLKSRFAALGLIVILVLASLLLRLWSMQVLSGETYAAQAKNNRIREISLDAPRGRILDRNGKELVTNRATLAVSVDPANDDVRKLIIEAQSADKTDDPTRADLERVFGGVAELLGMTPAEVFEKVSDSRVEALRPRVVAIDVPLEVISQLSERQQEFPGVRIDEVAVREYPYGSLGAHVIGYTGEISEKQMAASDPTAGYELGDIVGKAGVESQYENVLQGDKGRRLIEVNASGKPQRIIDEQRPVPGRDIKLTIDIEVQKVAEQALADAITEAHRQNFRNAEAGAAVVIDVKTGEVLAMASAPTYDPATFLGGISQTEWTRLTDKASEYPLNNRAVMAAYPPASTFKAVTGLAGLQTSVTYSGKTYNCAGKWTEMGKQWPKWCWNHSGHGTISFDGGIEESCDTVFYEIGYEFYKRKKEELQSFSRTFGLGTDTGIDLPGEVSGRIPDAAWKKAFNENYPEYQTWLPGDTVNMAIGQGDLLVTPLQMATTYAGIANGGVVMKPHVLRDVLGSDGKVARSYEPSVLADSGVSAENLAIMRSALVRVTTQGTGAGAFRGFGVTVAGKTGTAQVYGKDDYAWFCAFAPAQSPKYAVAVVVEQGGHGGSVTAPAARNILAKLLGQKITTVHTTDNSR